MLLLLPNQEGKRQQNILMVWFKAHIVPIKQRKELHMLTRLRWSSARLLLKLWRNTHAERRLSSSWRMCCALPLQRSLETPGASLLTLWGLLTHYQNASTGLLNVVSTSAPTPQFLLKGTLRVEQRQDVIHSQLGNHYLRSFSPAKQRTYRDRHEHTKEGPCHVN